MRRWLAGLLLLAGQAQATTYYVDPLNGASTGVSGTSVGAAFKGPYQAVTAVVAGDTVCLMNTANITHFSISGNTSGTHLGTSSNHILWHGCDGSGTPITFNWANGGLNPSSALPIVYIEPAATTTVALQIKDNNTGANEDGSASRHPVYMDFVGISFQGTKVPGTASVAQDSAIYINSSDHISFSYCEIAYGSAVGLGTDGSQYVSIDHCMVHDNAHSVIQRPVPTPPATSPSPLCTYGSGISFLRTYDWANVTASNTTAYLTPTERITNSYIYDNYNDASRGVDSSGRAVCPGPPTDGEGIILDRNDGSCQGDLGCSSDLPGHGAPLPPYIGKILISGNVLWSNGGPGIHAFLSSGPLDILNNTLWHNNSRSTNAGSTDGEINLLQFRSSVSGAIPRIENNIVDTSGQTITGSLPTCKWNGTSCNYGTAHTTRHQYCISDTSQVSPTPPTIKNNLCYDEGPNGFDTHFTTFSEPVFTNQTAPSTSVNINGSGWGLAYPSGLTIYAISPKLPTGTAITAAADSGTSPGYTTLTLSHAPSSAFTTADTILFSAGTASPSLPTPVNLAFGNPLFKAPADLLAADYRMTVTTSPAFGFVASSGEFATPDIIGDTRSASSVTAGAYQNAISTVIPPPPPPVNMVSGSGHYMLFTAPLP